MRVFTIDAENRIIMHSPDAQAGIAADASRFTSVAEFARLTADWPAARLVEVWNGLPAAKPVTRFTDRKTAVARIWKALQETGDPAPSTQATAAPQAPEVAPSKAAPARRAARHKGGRVSRKKAGSVRRGTRKAEILGLLHRPQGATLAEIMEATGWQPHSIRGFISGSIGKKMKLSVECARRENGERVYSIAG